MECGVEKGQGHCAMMLFLFHVDKDYELANHRLEKAVERGIREAKDLLVHLISQWYKDQALTLEQGYQLFLVMLRNGSARHLTKYFSRTVAEYQSVPTIRERGIRLFNLALERSVLETHDEYVCASILCWMGRVK